MSDRKKEQAVERALYIMKRTRWILYRKQPIKQS